MSAGLHWDTDHYPPEMFDECAHCGSINVGIVCPVCDGLFCSEWCFARHTEESEGEE
jgi:hypothetical protein